MGPLVAPSLPATGQSAAWHLEIWQIYRRPGGWQWVWIDLVWSGLGWVGLACFWLGWFGLGHAYGPVISFSAPQTANCCMVPPEWGGGRSNKRKQGKEGREGGEGGRNTNPVKSNDSRFWRIHTCSFAAHTHAFSSTSFRSSGNP